MAASEQTRRMVDPAGKSYDIPFSKVEEASKDGLEFTTPMAGPDGAIFHIPASKQADASADGLKIIGAVKSPFEAKSERVAAAPTTLWGAITGPEGSFSSYRERNQAEGKATEDKANALIAQNPNMDFMTAYKNVGGEVNTGYVPLAYTGPVSPGLAGAKDLVNSTATGRFIFEKLATGVGAGWNGIKNLAKGTGIAAGMVAGGKLTDEATGGSISKFVSGLTK